MLALCQQGHKIFLGDVITSLVSPPPAPQAHQPCNQHHRFIKYFIFWTLRDEMMGLGAITCTSRELLSMSSRVLHLVPRSRTKFIQKYYSAIKFPWYHGALPYQVSSIAYAPIL